MHKPIVEKKILENTIISQVSKAIEGLKYGTVLIKVHDSKIIQMEVTEKKRFDSVWNMDEGGGI